MMIIRSLQDSTVPTGPLRVRICLEAVVCFVISAARSHFWYSAADTSHRLFKVFFESLTHTGYPGLVIDKLFADMQHAVFVHFQLEGPVLLGVLSQCF